MPIKIAVINGMILAWRIEQHLPNKTYRFVPLQDFT